MHIHINGAKMKEACLKVAQTCMFNKTRTISRYVTNLYTNALKDIGVTPVQFSILTAVQLIPNANVNHLSSALMMDRTTLNRNLKPLLRDRYIDIQESTDRRERKISITPEGQEVYEKGYEKWEEAQRELEEVIGTEDWLAMNSLFDTIIAKIK